MPEQQTTAMRRLRKAAGVTLQEVAQGAGIGVSTLWNFETGRRAPGVADKARIVAAIDDLRSAQEAAYNEALRELA